MLNIVFSVIFFHFSSMATKVWDVFFGQTITFKSEKMTTRWLLFSKKFTKTSNSILILLARIVVLFSEKQEAVYKNGYATQKVFGKN